MTGFELVAFYREQSARMLAFALDVSSDATKLELTEMAAAFQRLALREEQRAAEDAVDFVEAKSA